MIKAKKTGTKKSHYTTLVLPPCKICSGEATGYHFGVITCEACKAFFRRALVQKRPFKCKKDQKCTILPNQTKNCAACRLQLCKLRGMSPEGVRRGRFSLVLRTQAIVEANCLEGKLNDVVAEGDTGPPLDELSNDWLDITNTLLLPRDENISSESESGSSQGGSSPNPCLDTCAGLVKSGEMEYLIDSLVTSQELIYPDLKKHFSQPLQQLHSNIFEEFSLKQEIFNDVFGSSRSVTTEEHQKVFAETGVDLDDRLSHLDMYGRAMEESIKQYAKFVKLIPGFELLEHSDTSTLMKAAHLEVWFFGSFMLFNNELGVAICWDGSQNGTKEHMTRFFPPDWIDSNFTFADSLSKLQLTFQEIAIIRAIVLTAADRCSVQEKGKVQTLQDRFLEALRYHLARTSKTPARRLAKIFDRLLVVRSMNKHNVHVNQLFLEQWGFIANEFPLWKDMLSYQDY